jgi:hypothetical protein
MLGKFDVFNVDMSNSGWIKSNFYDEMRLQKQHALWRMQSLDCSIQLHGCDLAHGAMMLLFS